MWWEPHSAAEADLQAAARRLQEGYRSLLLGASDYDKLVGTPIRGVGAGVAARGSGMPGRPTGGVSFVQDWHPLVLVDRAALPGVDVSQTRIPWDTLREEQVPRDLYSLDLQRDTLIEPVGPLAPAADLGGRLTSPSAGTATIGLPVHIRDPAYVGEGFLTVAHGTPPPGGAVTVQGRTGVAIAGTVLDRSLTTFSELGGDDIALVGLPQGSLTGFIQTSGVQAPPAGPPYQTLMVDLLTGQSGHVLAQVTGALLQLGDQTWQWLDCWELGGTTPGMRPGDSGSLAYGPTAPHPIFGHFVGGAANERGPGFTHHWVQDLGQVLKRHPTLDQQIQF